MFGKIVSLAGTYVVSSWAQVSASYVYECTRVYLDYRFFDKKSEGYMFKNGTILTKGFTWGKEGEPEPSKQEA